MVFCPLSLLLSVFLVGRCLNTPCILLGRQWVLLLLAFNIFYFLPIKKKVMLEKTSSKETQI